MSMECIICWDGLTQPVAIPCDDPSLVRRLYLPIDDPEPYAPYTKATTIRVYEDLMDHNTRHIIELQDELSKLQVNETTCNVQLREALLANALSAVREKQLKQELTDLHLFLAELGGM
ncbi:hypothetical protein PC9H_006726 [Pleurotus ostreatus]|uniref:Uncharacterized protein n=1 Tax=Pleurotus ostreatus TaxID=5322 RepID=A0A8H7DT55_PLEOS|nr:uncharacterized protein PC9H_006726 [Pleurotus ostreatus]KAF7431011.1 hypothetical protein PC9H_006726 [Pleurotus ostreatus]